MRTYKLRSYPGTDFAIVNGTVCRRAWDPMKGRPSADTWESVTLPVEREVLEVARKERRGSWWSKAGR